MGSRIRFAALIAAVLSLTVSSLADDGVYRYRTREGRTVFTNAGRVEVGGRRPDALSLPALSRADLADATAEQLRTLDRGVVRAHEALQSGERCDAIRATSRLPMQSFYFREHLREVIVGIGLLLSALLVAVAWGGRLRQLMPLPPLLAAAYVGYATYDSVDTRLSMLHEGLRACSSELPSGSSADPSVVKQRLESALSLQAMVDRVYARQSVEADQIMKHR